MSGIRSISEGTFVIGDTNGLTFEAGPGISVSQPSEGTVRIANDETVLWSGTGDILTSESITNFERIRIITDRGGTCEVVPNGTNIDFALMFWSEDDTSAMQFYSGRLSSSDGKTFTYSRVIRLWTAGSSGTGGNTGSNQKYIVKVIGINRISGGNA